MTNTQVTRPRTAVRRTATVAAACALAVGAVAGPAWADDRAGNPVHTSSVGRTGTSSFPGCPLLVEAASTGPCVERLQRSLNEVNADYDLPVTGFFGRSTRVAVLDFQGRNGLGADGNVGSDTARALARQAGEHGSVASPRPAPRVETTEREFWKCLGKAGEGVVKVKKLQKIYQLHRRGASKAGIKEVATGIPAVDLIKIFACLRHGPN